MSEIPLIGAAIALVVGLLIHPVPAQSPTPANDLCVDGHPAKRQVDVTYAQLPPRHGFQRDHRIPLCLGGSDTVDNIQYQPWPEAREKDAREWQACEDYCAGRATLEEARGRFEERKPR